MQRLVLLLIILLGFGAQSALACTEGEAGVQPLRTVSSSGAPVAFEPDRLVGERHCDCPARDDSVQAAVIETAKSFPLSPTEGFAAAANPLFVERCRVLDARSRLDSDAFPASHLPPYLLTARLRY